MPDAEATPEDEAGATLGVADTTVLGVSSLAAAAQAVPARTAKVAKEVNFMMML